MDLSKALLLVAAVFGIVQLLKALLPEKFTGNSHVTVGLVILSSIAATFGLANSVWAHSQVIGDQHLDQLGTIDLVIVSLFVAGAAAFGSNVLSAVRNIGQNQLNPEAEALQNEAMRRALTAQHPSTTL